MMVPELYCLIKPASGACNMACRYCFYADEMAHREVRIFPRMSEATARNLIRKAYAFARRGVTFAFQGGEPLMAGLPFFRDFVALSQQLNPGLQVRYAIQTNGTLIDEPTAEFLAQHRFWWAFLWMERFRCTTSFAGIIMVKKPVPRCWRRSSCCGRKGRR